MPDPYQNYLLNKSLLDSINADPDSYSESFKNIISNQVDSYSKNTGGYHDSITTNDEVTNKALKELEENAKRSAEPEELYGFIPTDWAPDWIKSGYNNSIEGLATTIATGKEPFDLRGYHPNILEDVGSTLISFFAPADMAALYFGGGIGGIVGKAGMRQAAKVAMREALGTAMQKGAVKKVLKKPVKKEIVDYMLTNEKKKAVKVFTNHKIKKKVAEEIVEKSAPRVLHRAMAEGAAGAVNLGFYSGLQSALGQEVQDGDIEFLETMRAAGSGAILGGVTAGTGAKFGNYLAKKFGTPTTAMQKTAQMTAVKALETAEFGTIAPALEGRMPTPEDYAHALGVIGGLTAIKGIPSAGMKKAKQKFAESLDPEKTGTYIAQELAGSIASQQIWVNSQGKKLKGEPRFFNIKKKKGKETIKEEMVELTDPDTGKKKTLTKDTFYAQGFQRRKRQAKPDSLESARRRETFKIFNRLKEKGSMTLDQFRSKIEEISGVKIDFTKEKQSKTGYSNIMKDQNKVVKLLDSMRNEELRVKTVENLKKEWDVSAIPTTTLLGHLVPEFLKQGKNRVTTPLGVQTTKEIYNTDARAGTLSGEYIQAVTNYGLYKYGFFKKAKGTGTVTRSDGKKIPISKASAKEYYEDLGRRIGDSKHQGDKDVKKYRKILNEMWDTAEQAGIKLSGKRENYFPDMLKPEWLEKITEDFYILQDKYPFLFEGKAQSRNEMLGDQIGKILESEMSTMDPATVDALKHMQGKIVGESKGGKDKPTALAEAFARLNQSVFYKRFSIAPNLEKQKRVELPDYFYERDARIVLTKYIHDWARRTSYVEAWGNRGEVMEARITALKKMAEGRSVQDRAKINKEVETITQLWESYTNAIERNPTKKIRNPVARKVAEFLVNFEVASKIGLGYATIPNMTQVLISSAIKAGYWNTFKGIYKLARPTKEGKEYRDLIRKDAEFSRLSFFQMMAGIEPANSRMAAIADGITRLNQFQRMNKYNLLMSGAAGYEYIQSLKNIATRKGGAMAKISDMGVTLPERFGGRRISRREWALENLKEMGIKNIEKTTTREMSEAVYSFARDTQLQRNVLNDPLFFNDPRFRPLVLFKRFGYRQAAWIKEQLVNDVIKRGNFAMPLRLMVSGFIGGQFVMYAKKALNDFLSGEDTYDENQLIFPWLPEGTMEKDNNDIYTDFSKLQWSDVLDMFANVGAFGTVADIVASENKVRALEFAIKPAIYQDSMKLVDAVLRTHKDMKDYGIGFLPRMPKYYAPIFGTVPRRVAKQLEPTGQKQSYLEYRKGLLRSRILDHLIDGNSEMATRLIRKWNKSNPSEAFYYDDVSFDAVYKRLENKYKKRATP